MYIISLIVYTLKIWFTDLDFINNPNVDKIIRGGAAASSGFDNALKEANKPIRSMIDKAGESFWGKKSGSSGGALTSMDPVVTQQLFGTASFADNTDDIQSNAVTKRTKPIEGPTANPDDFEFLKRPVKIWSGRWNPGGALAEMSPWQLFIDNDAVARKHANYWLKAGTLHVKIVTNGNAYQYGKMIIGYMPNETVNPFWQEGYPQDKIARRVYNLPITATVDPSKDSVIELALPFTHPKEISVVENTQWQQIGVFHFNYLSDLRTTSGGALTPYVDLTMYAWMSDVQARYETEYFNTSQKEFKGILSKPLTDSIKFADKIKTIPFIGGYADAYSEAAKGVRGLTSLFGFSRPNNISEPDTVTVRQTSSYAQTVVKDTAMVLATDPRVQTIMDPQLAGISGMDEMVIAKMAGKYSLVHKTDWDQSDGVDTILFSIPIRPNYSDQALPRPMSHLEYWTAPFRDYAGDYKVKIEVVTCAFHTGRLQFWFEPGGAQTGIEITNTNVNVIYDLAQHSVVELTIPGYTNGLLFQNQGTGLISDSTIGSCGTLHCKVVSGLRAGAQDTIVDILVYLAAGEDWRVGRPTFSRMRDATHELHFFPDTVPSANPVQVRYMGYFPTSEVEEYVHQEQAVQTQEEIITAPATGISEDDYSKICWSETIISIRPLLKRYMLSQFWDKGGQALWYQGIRDFPNQAGECTNATGLNYFEQFNWSFLNYFGPAYLGYRGSLRKRMVKLAETLRATTAATNKNVFAVFRATPNVGWMNYAQNITMANMPTLFQDFAAGGDIINPRYQNVLEWSNPFSSRNPYVTIPVNRADTGSGAIVIGYDDFVDSPILEFTAAGDDFNFIWYIGPPWLHSSTIG